jgi:2-keto-4-pentenoate hydratase/2-oxohepta-3-ene-1,7-dioic acid hydratase in catechol pathway
MNTIQLDGETLYPSKIVCIGQNYVEHIKELGNEMPSQPVIFIKPNSAISTEIHSGVPELVHHEAELSFVVIGGQLAAVGFGLDLTKREVQTSLRKQGMPWERSKAFDGSAIFSDFVGFSGDLGELRLELYVNEHLVQQGGVELMINKPVEILLEAGSFLSFEDGDVIMTGTPKGVGPIHAGDNLRGRVFNGDNLLVEDTWVVK